jgi:hypothetical protein
MGEVEGNAVRPRHGPDNVDGKIGVQGIHREEGHGQEIGSTRQRAWPETENGPADLFAASAP